MNNTNVSNNPAKFYLVAVTTRPGVQLFTTKLEYTYFPPRSAANDDFGLNITMWEGLAFYVIEIPVEKSNYCKIIAKSLGMSISDGTPMLLDSGKVKYFPLQGDNVWTLEGKFTGNEAEEVKKIFDGDQQAMLDDFKNKSAIQESSLKDLKDFVEGTLDYNSYSPIMAVLFSKDSKANGCFMAYISNQPFAACTFSNNPATILGLYVLPKARKLGIGTKLFEITLQHLVKNGSTVQIDVKSKTVSRMIDKLSIAKRHCNVSVKDYDLTELEEPYVRNKDWYIQH